MKIRHIFAAGLLGLATLPASAAIFVYNVVMDGASEAPANASPGVGAGAVTIDDVLKTMRVQFSFSGLTGTTTAAHIHCCTSTAGAGTAGVVTTTPSFIGFPLGVTFGSMDQTYDMTLASSYRAGFLTANGGSTAVGFAVLLAGAEAGQAYLNIHTSLFPGGEIRGFLVPATTVVPLPAGAVLMLGGLVGMGAVLRRRKS